jgi:GH15 family glucan-1,4-alpha-glucosidase
MASRIEDYAIIGDCETAALVARDGSIDWLCWPRFDSPACFAALLGTPENGRWRLGPRDPEPRVTRAYASNSLVLETRFATPGGVARVVDFMPLRDSASDVIRIVVGEEGTVDFESELVVRFDYGSTMPWVNSLEDGTTTAIAGPDLLALRSPIKHHGEHFHTVARFAVRAGDRVPFVLTHVDSTAALPRALDAEAALTRTVEHWRKFAERCPPVDRWSDAVRRSLITLKALTYEPTGGIVAAATTSLPEAIGGPRNWDYRFCWLRDATFTLLAFMNLGYYDEAKAWRDWLMRAIAGSPSQLQIMYGLGGERRLPEWVVPWLPGYEGSTPVRIGNAAANQLQLDVFGEVADALYHAVRGGLPPHTRTREIAGAFLEHLEKIWQTPDEGIWEVRGERQHFTHSKVMTWVAFDRAARFADELSRGSHLAQHWRGIADRVHAEVCERAFDAARGTFVQAYGSNALDASLLLMPLVGFLPADDPRVVGTVRAIERELTWEGLVRRYIPAHVDDGVEGGEGVFLACSFWLAQVYGMQGRRAEGRELFERVLALGNDVGLFAEEYDPLARRQLGNFPQAFSHLGLINAAVALAGEEKETRADGED